MIDNYAEVLVARKRNMGNYILKVVVYAFGVLCLLGALLGINFLFFVGLGLFALGYFVCPSPDIEFEYLYLDKELSVDKIIAKQKRKKVASYDLNEMEKMCPLNSHELDAYMNKKLPIKDYSSGNPDVKPYVIVYRGQKEECLIYVDPAPELIKAIKNTCPRKVIEY